MFFVTQSDERPDGYVVLSHANQWEEWLVRNIPISLDDEVRRRLRSNLKHLFVGLELKAALIAPHAHRGPGDRPMLFESYFQNLIQEFCVGAFSVLEGLGAAHWLDRHGQDGAAAPFIRRDDWLPALCAVYDADCGQGLLEAVTQTVGVRDRLHQDKLGAREDIDWHAFSYTEAFVPAAQAVRTLLRRHADAVPGTTNLG